MIGYFEFKTIIENLQEFNKLSDNLRREYSIDITESFIGEALYRIFDTFISVIFTEEGEDLIFWWLYEDINKVIHTDDKEINIENIVDLYTYLVDNKETYIK